jgi:outer membrane protein assembly factor BamB
MGVMLLILWSGCKGGDGCGSWTQWGQSATHEGSVCATGQSMTSTLARIVYDPFNEQELADPGSRGGSLLVHYQSPLVVGDDVYMMSKGGSYTACLAPEPPSMVPICDPYRKDSQIWLEKGYRWEGGQLVEKWTFTSDYKPPPGQSFEPMFQPAVHGDFMYVPGRGGSVFQIDRSNGVEIRRIVPFADPPDPDTYVAGGLTVADDGTLYYTALSLSHDGPYTDDAQGWLVKVPEGEAPQSVTFASMVTGAPAPGDQCRRTFSVATTPRPWPPPDDENGPVLPPTGPCGSQRPGLNATPAIGADGTIVVVSKAHFDEFYSYVVGVRPDLTTRWATSLRGFLNDGCGVTVPFDDFNCRIGATPGVDPNTNEKPAGRVGDSSSSSPVALPDGSFLYGTFTGYNGFRGHLFKLDANGAPTASFDFGWDITPAIDRQGNTYSIVLKENNYLGTATQEDGPYSITRLKQNLEVDWRYVHAETQDCHRDPNGDIICDGAEHPNGFEWCINAPAIDSAGTVYALNENGKLYAIDRTGVLKDSVFLERTLGAAYTPLALDADGRIYAMNFGVLTVLGK